jgi:hypothetical protein
MITYASLSDFTAVYSLKGVTETEISSYWLQQGAVRVNEALGGYFTLPFSDNNYSAKDLNIKFTYLEILSRNRSGQTDLNVRQEVEKRVQDIRERNSPMILDDGSTLFANSTKFDAYSTTQNYNPTFNMLDAKYQRVDNNLQRDELGNIGVYYQGKYE